MTKLGCKYLFVQFLKPFIYSYFLFICLLVIGEIFDKMDIFLQYHAKLHLIFNYIVFKIPDFSNQILPLTVMAGVIFGIGKLNKQNELFAFTTSGIPLKKLYSLIIIFCLFLTSISYINNELFVPICDMKARITYKEKIKNQKIIDLKMWSNIVFKDEIGNFYSVGFFDAEKGAIFKVSIDYFTDDEIFEIIADFGLFNNQKWKLKNIIERRWNLTTYELESEKNFTEKEYPFIPKPEFFIYKEETEYLSPKELKEIAFKKRFLGMNSNQEFTDYYLKKSFPFANLIFLFIALSIGVSQQFGIRHLSSWVWGSAVMFLLAFIYWGLNGVGRTLGVSGTLPPLISSWLTNIVFFIAGIFLLIRK